MGGRVGGGGRRILSGAASVVIGGKDLTLGIVGCVTAAVGSLTNVAFCVGRVTLAGSPALSGKRGQSDA